MRPQLITLALASFLGLTSLRGEDWPEFRGPTGQGIARGTLPTVWSNTKNVVWKRAIPGAGWSSPVVADGRVYLTSSVPVPGNADNDQSLRAFCLDAATGKILWEKEVFGQPGSRSPRIHNKNSHASPTPLVHDRRLYVHFGHQGTACLDLDGNVLWRNDSLHYAPVHGNGGSPILAGQRLIFSCDGGDKRFIVALDCNTGKVLWLTDRQGEAERKFSFSTPLLIKVNGEEQVVSPGSNSVNAYDPKTGQEIWHVRYDGYSVIPRPIYGHGLVFICTGFNSAQLLAIRPDGKGDVTATHIAWTARKSVPLTPSLLLAGDELYMVADGGIASCLDAHTGQIHWQQRIGGNYSASPIAAGGNIYFQSEKGEGTVVKASTQFEQIAKNALGERTLASCAAADGALFMRTEKSLYRIQEQLP
jgi:outer membrane protein assembly factor BamB